MAKIVWKMQKAAGNTSGFSVNLYKYAPLLFGLQLL